jgi:hypothetical protein
MVSTRQADWRFIQRCFRSVQTNKDLERTRYGAMRCQGATSLGPRIMATERVLAF